MPLRRRATSAHGVMVVADAEHNADRPGGFGNPGGQCDDTAMQRVRSRDDRRTSAPRTSAPSGAIDRRWI